MNDITTSQLLRDGVDSWRRPLDWTTELAFAAYLQAGQASRLFYSRDAVEEMTHAAVTDTALDAPRVSELTMAARLTPAQRRAVVALTWPRPFEIDLSDITEVLNRTPAQMSTHVLVNFAAISSRWMMSGPPEVDGVPLELGRALQLLGPRMGISPALTRRLLAGQGPLVLLDELLTIVETLRLDFGGPEGEASTVSLPGLETDAPCWNVDAAALCEDVLMERRVLAYRDDLAKEWGRQRPIDIHRLRIEPFGNAPTAKSKFFDLFASLDTETASQFVLTIDDLQRRFAGSTRRELSKTARHQRGWWSNPRPDSAGRYHGVGRQTQRVAWRAAGYETTNVAVEPNPSSSGTADQVRVVSVTFRAIPGRILWHPFRHELRAGRGDPLSREATLRDVLARHNLHHRHWHDVVLAVYLGSWP